jgi:hypothetical protein
MNENKPQERQLLAHCFNCHKTTVHRCWVSDHGSYWTRTQPECKECRTESPDLTLVQRHEQKIRY